MWYFLSVPLWHSRRPDVANWARVKLTKDFLLSGFDTSRKRDHISETNIERNVKYLTTVFLTNRGEVRSSVRGQRLQPLHDAKNQERVIERLRCLPVRGQKLFGGDGWRDQTGRWNTLLTVLCRFLFLIRCLNQPSNSLQGEHGLQARTGVITYYDFISHLLILKSPISRGIIKSF